MTAALRIAIANQFPLPSINIFQNKVNEDVSQHESTDEGYLGRKQVVSVFLVWFKSYTVILFHRFHLVRYRPFVVYRIH